MSSTELNNKQELRNWIAAAVARLLVFVSNFVLNAVGKLVNLADPVFVAVEVAADDTPIAATCQRHYCFQFGSDVITTTSTD